MSPPAKQPPSNTDNSVRPKCFVIIPFKKCDQELKAVQKAARACRVDPIRGDGPREAGLIPRQILREIRQASIAIVVLTDDNMGADSPTELNANVVYELGIAHQILGEERVVILLREGKKCFYDISACRHLVYTQAQLSTPEFQKKLQDYINEAIKVHAAEESWNVVRNPLARTKIIVQHLDFVLQRELQAGKINELVIRTISGLGSLSISDREPFDASFEPEYVRHLRLERDKLRELLSRGARLKAIIMPPRRIGSEELSERLKRRYQRLIALLEGGSDFPAGSEEARLDQLAIRNCEIVLAPVPSPNLMIIGNQIAFEGIKRGGQAGFSRTHCETNPTVIHDMITQFDEHFAHCKNDLIRRESVDGLLLDQLKRCYQQATTGLTEDR